MIPDVEAVIADFKAGNYTKALSDALLLEPIATKAYTDCTASIPKGKFMKKIMGKMNHFAKMLNNVEDLTSCIADIEAMIPDVEKVIADFKAGNYEQALSDALLLEPIATKALADCKAGFRTIKHKVHGVLGADKVQDDP
jgi:hypothetical protein